MRNRNLRNLLGFSFFADLMVFYPFYNSMFINSGLRINDILTLLAVMQIGKILFDLPVGLIADLFDRKYIFLWLPILRFIMLALWILFYSKWSFMLGMFLFGASISCLFGNIESYAYDFLKTDNFVYDLDSNNDSDKSSIKKSYLSPKEKQRNNFASFISLLYIVQNGSISVASLLGYLLFNHIGYKGILLVSAFFCLIAFYFATLSLQYKPSQQKPSQQNTNSRCVNYSLMHRLRLNFISSVKVIFNNINIFSVNYFNIFNNLYRILKDAKELLQGAVAQIVKNTVLRYTLLWFLVHTALYIFMIDFHSITMLNMGLESHNVAIIISILTLIKFFVNTLVPRLSRCFSFKNILLVDGIGLMLLFFSSLLGNVSLIVAIFVFLILFSFSDIAIISLIQEELESEHRTVVMSGVGVIISLFVIIFQQLAIRKYNFMFNLAPSIAGSEKSASGAPIVFIFSILVLLYSAAKVGLLHKHKNHRILTKVNGVSKQNKHTV
ncbi:MAG: MFS transporter [Alphaproteobacteria bacterium]|nr:MFS transporter [Rickettsiales bacterium]